MSGGGVAFRWEGYKKKNSLRKGNLPYISIESKRIMNSSVHTV